MKELIKQIISSTEEVPNLILTSPVCCDNCAWSRTYDTLNEAKEVKVYSLISHEVVLIEVTCPVCKEKTIVIGSCQADGGILSYFHYMPRVHFEAWQEIFKTFSPLLEILTKKYYICGTLYVNIFREITNNVLRYFYKAPTYKQQLSNYKYIREKRVFFNENPQTIGVLLYLSILNEAIRKNSDMPTSYIQPLKDILEFSLCPIISMSTLKMNGMYFLFNAYIEDNFKKQSKDYNHE